MAAPEVNADVRVVPARRTASYSVPLESDRPKPRALRAAVNVDTVSLTSNYPNDGVGSDRAVRFPKTLEAADALIAIAQAVRAELTEQGVEPAPETPAE